MFLKLSGVHFYDHITDITSKRYFNVLVLHHIDLNISFQKLNEKLSLVGVGNFNRLELVSTNVYGKLELNELLQNCTDCLIVDNRLQGRLPKLGSNFQFKSSAVFMDNYLSCGAENIGDQQILLPGNFFSHTSKNYTNTQFRTFLHESSNVDIQIISLIILIFGFIFLILMNLYVYPHDFSERSEILEYLNVQFQYIKRIIFCGS